MTLRSLTLNRVFLGLCTCLALLGCSGGYWEKLRVDSPYEVPKRLRIAVDQGPATDEAFEALTAGLFDELASRGIKATIVTESDDRDVMVTIVEWNEGSRALRWIIGFGAGEGEVSIDVAASGVEGRAHGWVAGGFFGGSDEDSAGSAGRRIADTLATGQGD